MPIDIQITKSIFKSILLVQANLEGSDVGEDENGVDQT